MRNHPERIKRPSYLLREDVIKLDRYIAKAKLLTHNKIEAVEDLQTYRKALQEFIAHLTAERSSLRKALKRTEYDGEEPAKLDFEAQIKKVSASIQRAKKEVKLCTEIELDSTRITEKLRQIREDSSVGTVYSRVNLSNHSYIGL
ncbi:MAG: hypothetical protein IJK24_06435 [Oscillospiraceae bacterium]|nr:hypothetical protein [Oscillospiraceae bacterium]MBQ6160562.1 hypothetical protein [Oscillospiraceae bacterium]